MAARGSALNRAIRYFEEGDLREVRVAFQIVTDVMKDRLRAAQAPPVKRRRRRAAPEPETPHAVAAGA